MALETGTYINSLVATNPIGGTDPKSQGDDHIRLLKSTIKASFPNITGAVTASHTNLNTLLAGTGIEVLWRAQGKWGGILPHIDTPSVNTDWNTLTAPGWHTTTLGSAAANAPIAGFTYLCFTIQVEDTNNVVQIAVPDVAALTQAEGLFVRSRVAGTWNAWRKILWSTDVIALIASVNDDTMTFTNKTLTSGSVLFADTASPTKKLQFSLVGITAGQTSVLTVPNFDGTIATLAGTETFTNKTIDNAQIITAATVTATNNTANGAAINLDHDSASPAAQDIIAEYRSFGRDNAAASRHFSSWLTRMIDVSAASIDAVMEAWTATANVINRRFSVGNGLWMEGSGSDPGVGKINATGYEINGTKHGHTDVAMAAGAGTSVQITGIPAGVYKVEMFIHDLRSTDTTTWRIQIGDSGGFETSGYSGSGSVVYNVGSQTLVDTDGAVLFSNQGSNARVHGTITFNLAAANNTWTIMHTAGDSVTALNYVGGCGKALTGVLDRVRIISDNGTATFAGNYSARYYQ